MVIYCYFNKENYINWCFVDVMKIHSTIGNSDHSSLPAVISMAEVVPTCMWIGKFSWNIKSIGIQSVVQYGICPALRNIWLADNPDEVLNEHLALLIGRYLPTKVIHVRNKDKPWFDDLCSHALGLKKEAQLRWTRDRSGINGKSLSAVKWELMKPIGGQASVWCWNWLRLYQECWRAVCWARCCSSCTLRSFFPFWKISWSVMLMSPLWWLLCHPQASELVYQSPWSVTFGGLVSGVTFGRWNWIRVRPRLW